MKVTYYKQHRKKENYKSDYNIIFIGNKIKFKKIQKL